VTLAAGRSGNGSTGGGCQRTGSIRGFGGALTRPNLRPAPVGDHRYQTVGIFEFDRDEWDAAFTAARALDDPWQALMTLVDKIADDASSPLVSGLMVEVLAQAHHDAEFAALLAENDRRMTDCFAELLDAAASHGTITPNMPSAALARWIGILTDGLYGRGYAEPDLDPAADLATVKQLIARMAGRDT
jgi:hypothetical protein